MLIHLLALAAISDAFSFRTSEHIADFDDLPYELSNTNAIELYAGLYWSRFARHRPPSDWSTRHGISPSSRPCYALSASDAFGGLPAMHAANALTGVSFFDLQSFRWGCLMLNVTSQTPAYPETPTDCSLTIQCFEPGQDAVGGSHGSDLETLGKSSATAVYLFTVTPAMRIWGVRMAGANLGGYFRACQRVTWDVRALAGGGTRQVALALDDVRFRAYRITAWDWKGLGEVVHENGPFGIA